MSRQRIRSSMLESSTDKCPHCGGTGLVRSVSSVTLQLLRAIEETLLKGATHNLIARTRTDIALYVLNQKRAHLRDLENRFKISITIHADAAINGQQPFVIERGEQVHSLEAARAIAAHPEAPVADVVEAEEDEAETASRSETFEARPEPATAQSGEATTEGGRRRRRRRRRGRRSENHEAAAVERHEATPETPAHAEEESESDEAEAGFARPVHASEAESGEEARSEERRRRRRGRRGGRRNRREGGEPHEPPMALAAADHGSDTHGTAEEWSEGVKAQPADAEAPPPSPAPAPSPAATLDAEPQAASAPPAEREPSRPGDAAQPEQPAASEPPKRRSTVREPVSLWASGHPPLTQPDATPEPAAPSPAPAPPAPSITVEESPSEEAERPRRTGWWTRRMFGKG